MAALTQTVARPASPVRGRAEGNVRVRYFNVTFDTGDYAQAGQSFTAASLGFKVIYFVSISGGVIQATSPYATAAAHAITYASDNTSFNLFLYESAGDGDGFDNKPAEANTYVGTFRIKVEGY